jgi:predicted RNA-binding protein with PUA-like domain
MPQYWLMKSEPDEASIDDLANAPGQRLPWTGVRNYQARNFMRDRMKVGVAEVCSAAYPDATQFDRKSKYFDAKSTRETPRWMHVDVKLNKKTRLLSLREMRERPELADMIVLRPGNRLSITPVEPAQWRAVLTLLRA